MPPADPNTNIGGSYTPPTPEEQEALRQQIEAARSAPSAAQQRDALDKVIGGINNAIDTSVKYWGEKGLIGGLTYPFSRPTVSQTGLNPNIGQPGPTTPGDPRFATGSQPSPVQVIATEKSPVTKSDSVPQTGSTAGGAADTAAADTAAGQREIPCPICTGSFLINFAGRVFSSICNFIGKTFNIRAEIITTIKDYVIERLPYGKRAAFTDGKCPTCGGKGTITDVTDDRAKYAEAASIAQSKAPEIEENEARLGTGGNEYKIMAGHCVHEIGLGINDCPSFRQDPEGGVCLHGFHGWGKNGQDPKTGPLPGGGRYTTTTGINPIASPGGQYTIKCSNKFAVLTGALGVEIVTGGPLTLKGGITRITGPEITIGTQVGKVCVEGEVLQLIGDSVEAIPKGGKDGKGQFVVKGTSFTTGNHTVAGNLHAESASIVKLSMVGKNEPSKLSSPSNLYSGPAFWGGGNPEGVKAALKELLGFVTAHVANPVLAQTIPSPRYADSILDNEINIAYMSQPAEPVQTGVAVVELLGVRVCAPVYNFPHIHANFDQPHYHETRIPDIDCTAESAKELRAKEIAQASPAPANKKSTSIIDVARSFYSAIGLPFQATWYPLTKNIQEKVVAGKLPCP